jgi:hypothetical protein
VTRERFRTNARFFTRDRKLPFQRVATLVLSAHRRSMQPAINSFFTALQSVEDVPTASAYSQARRKLQPELFVHLLEAIDEEFYDACPAEQRRLWCGRRLVGCDGTFLTMPNDARLAEQFSWIHADAPAAPVLMGLATVCYDLLHGIAISAALTRRMKLLPLLEDHHLGHLEANDVLVADREFGDTGIFAMLAAAGHDYIVRLQRNTFGGAVSFMNSVEQEAVITVEVSSNQRAACRKRGYPVRFDVRLVKIALPDGSTEILATSLLDAERYSHAALSEAYRLRWNEEVYFDRVKNIFEVERFSSAEAELIRQDFHGIIYLSTLESMLTHSAQLELNRRYAERQNAERQDAERQDVKPQRHYRQSVNHAVSYAALLERVVLLLCDSKRSDEQVLAELQRLLLTKPNLDRPGRKPPRHKRRTRERLRHEKYRRRPPV